ncbi:MAG: asparagine synthase B [Bacteriovoracaceae bacterium]|nr:asparagine synthase B [Bacteriovoracaceae bacterium]
MCGLFASMSDVSKIPEFTSYFNQILHRGPDSTVMERRESGVVLAFHRLAIMDTTHAGDQPLKDLGESVFLLCNGEIYNFEYWRKHYQDLGAYRFQSHSDCEVILPLYLDKGIAATASALDAEFAFVIWDDKKQKMFAARDPIGIRPLFYGYSKSDKKIMFASEAKVLVPLCDQVQAFPPGHYYDGEGKFIRFKNVATPAKSTGDDLETILEKINQKLTEGVRKRLVADVPVGFLLSGGLDSSLVCGIAAKMLKRPLITFSVGLRKNPIDLPHAKKVAEFIKSNHHEVYFTEEETLQAVREVIWHLETWDITTVRASIPMYLVCKYIRKHSKIKVLLTGEVSDEIFGYKYTDFAPSAEEFQKESVKRIEELYMYDVLRADRCIAAHSLEARVPFADLDFVEYCMSIPGLKKMNTHNMGKWLLRKAFEKDNFIPDSILWRDKAAFSDAVGHSMVETLKAHSENLYTDEDIVRAKKKYPYKTPFTKESLWYRDIFEEFYPGKSDWIKDFWMPNKSWKNCDVQDPSARVLPNYGKSGD